MSELGVRAVERAVERDLPRGPHGTPGKAREEERKLYAPWITFRPGKRFLAALILAALILPALILPGAALPGTAGAAPGESEEHWYRIEMAGAPAGFVHERVTREGDEVVTESETRLDIRRATASLRVELAQRFVETPAGEPRRAWMRQSLGQMPIETSWEFTPDEVRAVHRQGDQERRETLPRPARAWVTPARAAEILRQHLASGAERFTIVSVDPLAGLEPVGTLWKLEERDLSFPLPTGETVRASRWRQTQDLVPGVETVTLVDEDGRMLESRTQMMGLEMVVRLAGPGALDEETSRAAEAPEILVRTFVRPLRPLERPRQIERAVYVLSVAEGELPELPSAGAQRVEPRDAKSARVVVDASSPGVADPVDPVDPVDPEAFLGTSTWLAHEDPLLRALVEQALGAAEGGSPEARAETLRAFVHDYLAEKDLDTGLATATEVARSKSGDCTEHSVLLAALLRGAGIPSRIAAGLVYVERFAGENGVFGYHMWTQALIDGRWRDLDATFEEPFDATHIALATTPFADQPPPARALARLAVLMGRVRIDVQETSYGR